MTCPLANMFGQPNSGIHKCHIGPFAVFDTLATLVASLVIALLLRRNVLVVFCILFVIGELMHVLFGVQTTFLTWINVHVNC